VETTGHTTPEAPELQRLAGALVDAGAASLVIEVTSHGLKLARVHGTCFRVVAFTNLTQDHLDLHGSMADYGATKLTLFTEELRWSPDAIAVVNVDDPLGERIVSAARCPVLTVSTAPGGSAGVRVLDRELSVAGVRAELDVAGERVGLRSALVGEHNLSNLAVALGICKALGLPLDVAAAGIAGLARVPGRLEPVPDPRGSAVLVDYAHTPDALSRVTEALAGFAAGRLIVVFGCGGDRDRSKRPRMAAAAAAGGDVVVLTSDNPRSEDPLAIIAMALEGLAGSGLPRIELGELASAGRGFAVEPDRRRAIGAAVGAARPGDVVLIAGKGHEDYQILGDRRIHFDDREEAAAAIRAAMAGAAERGGEEGGDERA
jgi:UDP-N-acetylmuramyl-tripeptide synthetase